MSPELPGVGDRIEYCRRGESTFGRVIERRARLGGWLYTVRWDSGQIESVPEPLFVAGVINKTEEQAP